MGLELGQESRSAKSAVFIIKNMFTQRKVSSESCCGGGIVAGRVIGQIGVDYRKKKFLMCVPVWWATHRDELFHGYFDFSTISTLHTHFNLLDFA